MINDYICIKLCSNESINSNNIKVVIDNKGTMVNLEKLIPFPY